MTKEESAERRGSIHDLDSAPEAPSASYLSRFPEAALLLSGSASTGSPIHSPHGSHSSRRGWVHHSAGNIFSSVPPLPSIDSDYQLSPARGNLQNEGFIGNRRRSQSTSETFSSLSASHLAVSDSGTHFSLPSSRPVLGGPHRRRTQSQPEGFYRELQALPLTNEASLIGRGMRLKFETGVSESLGAVEETKETASEDMEAEDMEAEALVTPIRKNTTGSGPGSGPSWSEFEELENDSIDSHQDIEDEIPFETPVLFGVPVPMWLMGIISCRRIHRNQPSATQIGAFLARRAPCFWCCGNALEVGASDRSILYRLNLLCAFFALGQIAAAALLVVALYSPRITDRDGSRVNRAEESQTVSLNLWNLNASVFYLGVLGFIVFFLVTCTLKVIREVNLQGAVRYLWFLAWLLPLQIFFIITLFDYHKVMYVWVRHWWPLASMSWFRELFCEDGTYNSLCVVPVDGGGAYSSEYEWCLDLYNSTNCTEIRDTAQQKFINRLYPFYYVCAVWGIVLILLLILTMKLLEAIITRPIMQSSREANMPLWMLFPIIGCFSAGGILLFSQASIASDNQVSVDNEFVGVMYIVSGGMFFVTALFGWFIGTFSILNSRDKKNKNVAVIFFIILNAMNAVIVGSIFVGSVLLTTSLVDLGMTDQQRGQTACAIDTAQSCSFCGNRIGLRECPEWTEEEVIKVLQTQYKSAAALAAIFILYAITALRYGITLKKYIAVYQIDYV